MPPGWHGSCRGSFRSRDWRTICAQRGLAQARRFSWADAARRYLEVYAERGAAAGRGGRRLRLRVGFDIRPAQGPSGARGIGRYTLGLLRALAQEAGRTPSGC